MAYSDALAKRVRRLIAHERQVTERQMFGGLAFMVRGHMCCGIQGERLMARVGPDLYEKALTWPHARPMDFTGKPLRGFLYVQPAGLKTTAQLRRWVRASLAYVRAAPPKRTSARRESTRGRANRESIG